MRKLLTILILVAAIVLAYYILRGTPKTPLPPPPQPTAEADPPTVRGTTRTVLTWNLYNFGRSKDDQEMAIIANHLVDYDVVALQEVSTTAPGPDAVARLDAVLDGTGTAWDYVVSEPTEGPGSERYAFLWKADRIALDGSPWLAPSLAADLDREPFLARFTTRPSGAKMLIASFHAVPSSKQPANEVVLLDRLHQRYPDDHLVILGDFNLPQRHRAFDGLRALGYEAALTRQKTSIRMKRKDGEHLANEYDNIFVESGPLRTLEAGVIDFTEPFATLREARKISDHLPVFVTLQWN